MKWGPSVIGYIAYYGDVVGVAFIEKKYESWQSRLLPGNPFSVNNNHQQ